MSFNPEYYRRCDNVVVETVPGVRSQSRILVDRASHNRFLDSDDNTYRMRSPTDKEMFTILGSASPHERERLFNENIHLGVLFSIDWFKLGKLDVSVTSGIELSASASNWCVDDRYKTAQTRSYTLPNGREGYNSRLSLSYEFIDDRCGRERRFLEGAYFLQGVKPGSLFPVPGSRGNSWRLNATDCFSGLSLLIAPQNHFPVDQLADIPVLGARK